MTFLAPWALPIGAGGALGVVLLHLVSRHRPAAYLLPTTRFIPDQQTLVSRAASTPSDLWVLLLRVLLIVSAAAAFANPVLTPHRGSVAQVILVDRSAAVASFDEVASRLKVLLAREGEHVVVVFDTAAVIESAPNLDSLFSGRGQAPPAGSISAAMLLGRREATLLAERADSVRMVLVSPVAAGEVDSATGTLRALWPGSIEVDRVSLRADSSRAWSLDRAIPLSDPLGPALQTQGSRQPGLRTRLVRAGVSAQDSAFAHSGGTVVRWDSSATGTHAEGLSAGGDVTVAALARSPVLASGEVVARWADATAAAVEWRTGAGCIRHVGVGVPVAGDLPLDPTFQRIARRLLTPCGVSARTIPVDSATLAMLRGPGTSAVVARAMRSDKHRVSRLVRVLLAIALLCAAAELFVRVRMARIEAVNA